MKRSRESPQQHYLLRLSMIGYGLIIVLSIMLLEVGARVLLWVWDSGLSEYIVPYTPSYHLDGYEQVDPKNPRNWI